MVVTGYGCLALPRVPFFKGREHHLKLTSHLSPYCRWLENENKAGVCMYSAAIVGISSM
jgi:hypothetical protein